MYQTSSFALHRAILFVNEQTIYSKAEIFVPSLSTLSFINPARLHSGLDSVNLSLLVPIQHLITFYNGINRNSAGYSLAWIWARSRTAIVSTSFLSTRQKSKHEIESRLDSLWNEEWIRSHNRECTRTLAQNSIALGLHSGQCTHPETKLCSLEVFARERKIGHLENSL